MNHLSCQHKSDHHQGLRQNPTVGVLFLPFLVRNAIGVPLNTIPTIAVSVVVVVVVVVEVGIEMY